MWNLEQLDPLRARFAPSERSALDPPAGMAELAGQAVFSLDIAWWLMVQCCAAREDADRVRIVEYPGLTVVAVTGSTFDDLAQLWGRTIVPVPFRTGELGCIGDYWQQHAAPSAIGAIPSGVVWFAGHGVGAATATLLAIEHLRNGGTVAGLYTFGAPRIGDGEFAQRLRFPVYRIVNGVDVMETLPPPWRFRHAGVHKLLVSDAPVMDTATPISRLGEFFRQSGWLVHLLQRGLKDGFPAALVELQTRVISDHAPRAYRDRLAALCGVDRH